MEFILSGGGIAIASMFLTMVGIYFLNGKVRRR